MPDKLPGKLLSELTKNTPERVSVPAGPESIWDFLPMCEECGKEEATIFEVHNKAWRFACGTCGGQNDWWIDMDRVFKDARSVAIWIAHVGRKEYAQWGEINATLVPMLVRFNVATGRGSI